MSSAGQVNKKVLALVKRLSVVTDTEGGPPPHRRAPFARAGAHDANAGGGGLPAI